MTNSRDTIRWMEALSSNNTIVHRIKPLQQFLVTLFFVFTVISFDKYSLSQLLPLFLYPAVMMVLGEIPPGFILRMILPVLPFILFMGVANPYFDRAEWILLPGITINAGWISALTLILRGLLTLTVSLIFMATAGIQGLTTALEKLKVPDFFITLLAFTYRYIHVLQEEAESISRAYSLRAPGKKGIKLQNWGPLGGQWFIRSFKRAERIHSAMSCRGLSGRISRYHQEAAGLPDYLWVTIWCTFFLLCRLFHLPGILGELTSGVSL